MSVTLTTGALTRAAGLTPTLRDRGDFWTDAEAFQAIRREARRLVDLGRLSYSDSEDAATDVWLRWNRLSGTPGMIRRQSPGYMRRSLRWMASHNRQARVDAHETLPLSAQPVQHDVPERRPMSPVSAALAARDLVGELGLPATKPVLATLTQGLASATAADVAAALGVTLAAWNRRVVDGRKVIRKSIGSPSTLAAILDDDLTAVRRTRTIKARTLGRKNGHPSDWTDADLLMSRPPQTYTVPHAARMNWTGRPIPAAAAVTRYDSLHAVECAILGGRAEGFTPTPDYRRIGETTVSFSDNGRRIARRRKVAAKAWASRKPTERPITPDPAQWWPDGLTAGMPTYSAGHPAWTREVLAGDDGR